MQTACRKYGEVSRLPEKSRGSLTVFLDLFANGQIMVDENLPVCPLSNAVKGRGPPASLASGFSRGLHLLRQYAMYLIRDGS